MACRIATECCAVVRSVELRRGRVLCRRPNHEPALAKRGMIGTVVAETDHLQTSWCEASEKRVKRPPVMILMMRMFLRNTVHPVLLHTLKGRTARCRQSTDPTLYDREDDGSSLLLFSVRYYCFLSLFSFLFFSFFPSVFHFISFFLSFMLKLHSTPALWNCLPSVHLHTFPTVAPKKTLFPIRDPPALNQRIAVLGPDLWSLLLCKQVLMRKGAKFPQKCLPPCSVHCWYLQHHIDFAGRSGLSIRS